MTSTCRTFFSFLRRDEFSRQQVSIFQNMASDEDLSWTTTMVHWMSTITHSKVPISSSPVQTRFDKPTVDVCALAAKGQLEDLRRFRRCGGRLDKIDTFGCSALHRAANADQAKVVLYLLEEGFDADLMDKTRRTALHVAAQFGHPYMTTVSPRDMNGWTPLHLASRWDHYDVARLLLEAGADVNAIDSYSWTPLHRAVIQKNSEIAVLLLQNGACPYKHAHDSASALSLAKDEKWRYMLENTFPQVPSLKELAARAVRRSPLDLNNRHLLDVLPPELKVLCGKTVFKK